MLPDPIYDAVEKLIRACGFDRSESATEDFYYMLRDVIDGLDGTIEASHEEGLCYNMAAAIAGALTARVNAQINTKN